MTGKARLAALEEIVGTQYSKRVDVCNGLVVVITCTAQLRKGGKESVSVQLRGNNKDSISNGMYRARESLIDKLASSCHQSGATEQESIMSDIKNGAIVKIPGITAVGTYAKDSGKGAMPRNPKAAKTSVNTSKIAGNARGKSLGPAVDAPLSSTYSQK